MNWIHFMAGGFWIYCVLFAGAFFITSNTHARQRTRRVKKRGNEHPNTSRKPEVLYVDSLASNYFSPRLLRSRSDREDDRNDSER
jgi:hypothetical protein